MFFLFCFALQKVILASLKNVLDDLRSMKNSIFSVPQRKVNKQEAISLCCGIIFAQRGLRW